MSKPFKSPFPMRNRPGSAGGPGLKCGPRALCGRLLAELKAFENQKMELLTGGELEFVPWRIGALLVGGLEYLLFSIYWESSSQLTNIFQRG